MTARGVDLGGEFRYLEPTYSGVLRANYMPSDKLRSADRSGHDWIRSVYGVGFAFEPPGGDGSSSFSSHDLL